MHLLLAAACVTKILFLGNSYTYFNNVPEIVTQLAKAGHQCTVEEQMITPGGTTLKNHWDSASDHAALSSTKWDFVVLQDQSSLGVVYYLDGNPRVSSDDVFAPYATKWAEEIAKNGARPVFYLTWARKKTPDDQAYLNYAYIHAARATQSVVAPVGMAWQMVRRDHPEIELYYRDGSHPSPAGSYLAACVIYDAIFGSSALGLPSKIEGHPVNLDTEKVENDKTAVLVDIPSNEAQALQSAAWRAVRQPKVADAAPPKPAPSLPPGDPLNDIAGTWKGKFLFYPGVGPVDLVLTLSRDDSGWRGHLDINYPVPDFKNESFELADLKVTDRELTFSDPKSAGVNNWRIDFRGTRVGPELRGIAETHGTLGDRSPATILGDWSLTK